MIATDGRLWTCMSPLLIDEIQRLRGAGPVSARDSILLCARAGGGVRCVAARALLLSRLARASDRDLAGAVLVELRLPRALLALIYGAMLGASGAAIQALFANPLASPDLTGTTSGAALGRGGDRLSVRLRGADRACRSARWPARLARLLLLIALAGPKAETATLLLVGPGDQRAGRRADHAGAGARPLALRFLRRL